MNTQVFASLLLAGLLASAGAAATQTSEGIYVPASQITAMVAKTTDGVATAQVPTGAGAMMLAAHRTADGQVEVHMKLNDEFVVRSGRATVLVGGKIDGATETAPGEWRGGKVTGAHAYKLGPGDVLWIPAGAPHQTLVPKGASFSYFAFKFLNP